MMWLGVDGGGTKTAFSLYDDDITFVDRLVLGTCHYAQVGFDGMERVLSEGVCWGLDRASHTCIEPAAPSVGIGFALCGYGEGADVSRRMDEVVERIAGARPHLLVNDVEAAWAAGLDCADGIAIISGTGSIALGVCRGESMRCGGWDYELGDEGSGGWLGKEALRAFTRQADGRDARGALYTLVRERLGIDDDFDVIGWAQRHYAERSSVSALAPIVTDAARAGDISALAILERAAQEEADMVDAIVRGLFHRSGPQSASIPVTYVGGTFAAGDLLLEPLARALGPGCRLVAPAHEPDLGPVLLLKNKTRGI